jgi:general secretion pathway protein H
MRIHRTAGFTLIEMLVVLAVLVLALGLVLTRGPVRSERLELDSAAHQVAGALRLARSRAISEQRTVVLAFRADGYRLDRDASVTWPGNISLEGNQRVFFTPDGGSSGARLQLRNGQRAVAIGIDWLTGRVIVRQHEIAH